MLQYRRGLAALLIALLLLLCAQPALAVTPEDYSSKMPQVLSGDYLYSQAALLMDADTGEVLLEKNADERMYPASTTKIMTLLLALESGISLDTEIVIPRQAADVPGDSSLVPVYPGDQTTFRDLLYGFMLSSGNDGANAVATLVGGDIQPFVEKMNERAQQLGCNSTHFVNAHGYHDPDHYTTARDLAIITRQALTIPTFRQIVSTSRYSLNVIRNKESLSIRINNTNPLLKEDSPFYYDGCIGVKTGFHSMAGQCFVGASEREGIRLVAVALNCSTQNEKWRDAIRMLNYGYTQYTSYTLEQLFKQASSRIATVRISNAISTDPYNGNMDLDIAEISDADFRALVRSDSDEEMAKAIDDFVSRTEMVITDDMVAPISKGEIMGQMRYIAHTGETITALLIASRDVAEQPAVITLEDIIPVLRYFENPLVGMLILVILAMLVLIGVALAGRRARKDRRRSRIYHARKREYERSSAEAERRRRRGPRLQDEEVDALFGGPTAAELPDEEADDADDYDEDYDDDPDGDDGDFLDLF